MSYSETSNVMDMPDERDVDIAKQIINTVIYNIENEDVNSMTEHEIKNYFMMSQQIEIYDEKFRAKGYYLVYDPVKGTSLTDSPNNCMKYDLAKLADRLLDKFCHRLRSMHLLGPAVKIYIDTYGTSRFSRFLQSSTATRKATAFDLKNVLRRACEGGYNLEGPLFMDCLEAIAMGPRGMTRVKDLVNEYVYQDESAETLVAMLAAENEDARYITEIKHTILEKLEKRFAEKPDSRMWLLIICSHNLVHAANNFAPAIELFLRFIISLSDSITYDQDRKDYYSSPGQLTYQNLIHIMSKFYRNPKTTQHIINFIFKQYACNPSVWGSALQACHNHPEEDSTAQQFYDSLYGRALTDPNLSQESLQMVLSKKC